MNSKNDTDTFTPYTTPQEALNQLDEAATQVMGLQLEITDALDFANVGYSFFERLRLRLQQRKYACLQKRIYKAMYGLPEIKVPERHALIERELRDPQPIDLSGVLDELAGMEDGESLFVGTLSKGQRSAAHDRAKKRGFVVELRRLRNGDYQLTRVMSHQMALK